MTQEFASVEIARDGDVVEVTLSRPEMLNRMDAQAHAELPHVFSAVAAMADVRAVVLGSTGKVFSAGGDFDLMLAMRADASLRRRLTAEARALVEAVLAIPAPVVVAMHGDAIGLGGTLALCCDAIVTHPSARISDPHVVFGMAAGDGGCLVWPQAVGMMRAKRHLLTGDPLTGAEANALGMVTDLVATRGDVLPAARALAARIAALPPLAVQRTKQALNLLVRARAMEVFDISLQYESDTLTTDDLAEAIDAFKTKRTARYTGS